MLESMEPRVLLPTGSSLAGKPAARGLVVKHAAEFSRIDALGGNKKPLTDARGHRVLGTKVVSDWLFGAPRSGCRLSAPPFRAAG
jgi:hypothetical protein